MRFGLPGSGLALAALLGLLGSCTNDTNLKATAPAEPAQLEAMIAQAELARAPSAELRALLRNGSPEVRARAALALGRIGDANAARGLGELLAREGADGATAAWALGRIAPATPEDRGTANRVDASDAGGTRAGAAPLDAEGFLRACLRTHCAQEVEAARALGAASRGAETLAQLASALEGKAPVAARAALSLGIMTRVGGKGADVMVAEAARAQLWKALARPESEVRRGAAYALGRIPRAGAEFDAASKSALVAALRDPDAETRAIAARAAGKQGLPAEELAGLLADPDWRVRVEASRALAVAPGGAALILPAIRAASAWLAAARDVEGARWAHPLVELFGSAAQLKVARAELPAPETLSGPTAAATVAVRCAVAEARDRSAGALLETGTCAAGLEPLWYSRFRAASLAAELAGDHPESPAGLALIEAFADTDPRVRGAAVQGASPAFAAQLIERLDDPDAYVVGGAAGVLAKDPAIARASLPYAARAVQRFSDARAQPTGNVRADALAALADLLAAALAPSPAAPSTAAVPSTVAAPAPAIPSPAPAPAPRALPPEMLGLQPIFYLDAQVASIGLFHSLAELQPLLFPSAASPPRAPAPIVPAAAALGLPGRGPRLRTLILTTTAGELRVRLFAQDGATPLTAAALATLANQGFYDGLSFHRVVPDFVAQGGDPLGDGEGGPGWALPDEHTPLPFLRGSLGIATSGPETGGSQIFFCHASEPHLDGRYTVAGQLESGEAAMDALQVGDRILRARAE